jgi:hypothetical protein
MEDRTGRVIATFVFNGDWDQMNAGTVEIWPHNLGSDQIEEIIVSIVAEIEAMQKELSSYLSAGAIAGGASLPAC